MHLPRVPEWIAYVQAAIAAASVRHDCPPFEVLIRAGENVFGVSIPSGGSTDGYAATCRIEGDPGLLERVMTGGTTLQSAHASGGIHLSGNPLHLLHFSVLLDRCTRVH
jgi:hypothetical protein